MSQLSEHLGIKVKPEFLKQIEQQADQKELKTSSYARMKLKEAINKEDSFTCPNCGKNHRNYKRHKEHVKRCFD